MGLLPVGLAQVLRWTRMLQLTFAHENVLHSYRRRWEFIIPLIQLTYRRLIVLDECFFVANVEQNVITGPALQEIDGALLHLRYDFLLKIRF